MQAIDYAKANHCNLVIVTDDSKEDWWYRVEHETKSPRVELIKEFAKLTGGQSFHMYRTGRFMELAKKYDKVTISDKSIKEVKETSSINYVHLFGRIAKPIDPSIWGATVPRSIGEISIPTVGSELQSLVSPVASDYIRAQELIKGSVSPDGYIPSTGRTVSEILADYSALTPKDYISIDTLSDNSTDNK